MRILDNDELVKLWGELEPKIQKALDYGIDESSSYDLLLECLNNRAQCWVHRDGVAITRFIFYHQYKQLQIVTTTITELNKDGLECLKVFEKFAKDTECRNIAVWGRPGWKRVLKDYTEPYTILIKEL